MGEGGGAGNGQSRVEKMPSRALPDARKCTGWTKV